jgi:sterol desaturase/sphingolipid hydroxylase (fatty acid hydroxylase superfamily)
MSIEVLSLLVIVGASVGIALLERVFPYQPGQRILRRGFWLDFAVYGLLQSWVLGLVISWVIREIDAASGGVSGLGLVRGWPVWVQLVFFVVTHDLYIYVFHRAMHGSTWLWRVHEAHHSTREVDWVAGARSHPLEILINQTIEWLPMILLGASPEVPVLKGVVSAVWGNFIHSNLDVRMGGLQYVINGPEMHRWHHAQELPWPGKNFATKLAVWDFVFGTAYYPHGAERVKPKAYGLSEAEYPEVHAGLGPWGQLVDTLRTYLRQTWAAFRPLR